MFCPHCASQNSNDAKYCRACQQNLKVISQAMKQSLPVLLASKFDGFIERTNERLRRDGILHIFYGVCFLTYTTWSRINLHKDWPSTIFSLLLNTPIICYFIGNGVFQLLAYRRSLSLRPNSNGQTSLPSTLYCPRCAEANENAVKFCRQCGEDLEVVSQAMTRRLPAFITNRLDTYIEEKNRTIRSTIRYHASLGFMFLLVGIILILFEPFAGLFVLTQVGMILFGCCMLLFAGWDLLVEKRSQGSPAQTKEMDSARSTDKIAMQSRAQFPVPPSVTESTTRRFTESADAVETEKESHF